MMGHRFLFATMVAMATVWYPVATADLAAINPNNLDKAAAHVCVTHIEETYTELESYTAYGVRKTTTWCLNWVPRCTEYMIYSTTAYRIANKVRTRDKIFCCEGYTPVKGQPYCKPKCKDDCNAANNKGYCALPDFCVCHKGWKGKQCESHCASFEWGPDCNNTCNCSSHGSCDPTNGNCICHIGWTGQRCDQMCVQSFGVGCVHPCICENNATCNNVNGKCTCQPNYWGAYCHKECDYTSAGEPTCPDTCSCQNGGECDGNNTCICQSGFKGEFCAETCDDFHWGVDCANACNCYNGVCDSATGECTCFYGYGNETCNYQCEKGYYGTLCATECPCRNNGTCYFAENGEIKCNCTNTGYHGSKCTQRDCPPDQHLVSKKCVDCDCPWATTDSCHPLAGKCKCKVGYTNATCNAKCSMPFWGQDCGHVCTCAHGDCHYVTGACMECYPGWLGTDCDERCAQGWWGQDCANKCGCLNNADCHEHTGFCNCTAGYEGLLCDKPCAKDKWGTFCEHMCTCDLLTSICNPYTGDCQCKPGYYGFNCEDKCPAWKYGFQCRHDCQCDRTGTKTCSHATGECLCAPGFKGVTCNSRCDDSHWGPNCQQSCDCSSQGSCDQNDGSCTCYAGYQGDKCEDECADGSYGYNCTEVCPQCTGGTYCDPATGQCVSEQCKPGLTGKNCQTPCPSGTWGLNCINKCSATCTANGICSPVNGFCFCFPGYSGTNCEKECPKWKYGIGCSNDCGCVKSNTQSCSTSRGKCSCKSGYEGDTCNKTCSTGTWGPDCQHECNYLCSDKYTVGCDPQRGLPCQCTDGWEPPTCTERSSINVIGGQTGGDEKAGGLATPIIVVIVIVALVLLVVIVLLVIFYSRRIRKLKEENIAVRYAADGTMQGETVIPNGRPLGLVNPTYAEENLNNERRYPHLSQRRPLPEPSRRCSGESFDSIEEEKRRAGERPESSHYHDLEDDRYTTLRSVSGAPTGAEGGFSKNLHTDTYPSKVADKYMLYTGNKDQSERSRSPQRSKWNSGDQNNSGFGSEDETDLKQNNINLAAAFRPSPSVAMETNRKSNVYETPQPTGLPKRQNYDNADINNSAKGTLTYDNVENDNSPKGTLPYDTPYAGQGQKAESRDNKTVPNGGYITPHNEVNDPTSDNKNNNNNNNNGNSDTLPFDTTEALTLTSDPERSPERSSVDNDTKEDAGSLDGSVSESGVSPTESANPVGWITFGNGAIDSSSSPYTNA